MDMAFTYDGSHGHAWLLPTREQIIADGNLPEHDATVASWIVEAAWAHPVWSNYWVYMAHLRPLDRGEGPVPTIIHLEGATHEMWIYACDPDPERLVEFKERGWPRVLNPINFAAQFKLDSDAAAFEIAEKAARDIADGLLNPDTDNLRGLITRFGSNMVKRR